MASLKYPLSGQGAWVSRAYASPELVPHPLGTTADDRFGRTWVWCQVGAADLVVGNCIQAAAQIADEQDMTPSAAAIGDRSISVTPGGTAARAADLFAGGMAIIDTTPGLGYSYPIKTHLAFTEPTAFVVQILEGWEIVVALTGTSRVSVYMNPYKNVIQTPVTTLTNVVVGVCGYILTTVEYGWIGMRGQFGTLIQGTPAVANALSCPATAAGAAAINSGTLPIIGTIMDTGQDGKVQAVRWNL